ncbi:MAG TPA: 23S rRNA pseudouridylate synthase, partial [Shigella sp.]|nr:23S rRNA pseudouridylate synthase [Shigella sp.]
MTHCCTKAYQTPGKATPKGSSMSEKLQKVLARAGHG